MVLPETVLCLSPTVSVLPLGDELSVYDAATGQTLALNRTAADVLSLLDGSTSIAELGLELSRLYPLPPAEVVEAVSRVADTLLAAGTLRVSGPRVAGQSAPS